MIDITTTVAEITAALEAYNALPEQHDCENCSQAVPGRQAPMQCATCGTKATISVNRVTRDGNSATWHIGTTQNAGQLGFQRVEHEDGGGFECGECRKMREQKRHEAAKAVAAKAEAEAEADAALAAAKE